VNRGKLSEVLIDLLLILIVVDLCIFASIFFVAA